jgi:hypothetical protein
MVALCPLRATSMVIMVVFCPLRTTSMVIMVAFYPICTTCERSMVALQNFPRRHLNAPIPTVLILSLCLQPLLKAPARDSTLAARPILSSPAAERHINGRCPLSPLIDGSYLDASRFPTPMARISMLAINAMAPSTALPPLYKCALDTSQTYL